MLDYGSNVVAGVTPGKGGMEVEGVPVYDSISEAQSQLDFDASILFIPARYVLDPALEAIEAGLDPVVVITEGVPIRDTMETVANAQMSDTTIIGPNCPGIIKPGEVKMGIMPEQVFRRGNVGIVSRSGILFYETASPISRRGLGQSTSVSIGGDPVVGLDFIDVLRWFEEDDETEAVALIGEIGGDAEERAASFIAGGGFTKPVAVYIAGRTAVLGKSMGHAGTIVQSDAGTAIGKIEALKNAGVAVGDLPGDVAEALAGFLGD
jgi:succinyl-CoA synthetase alpha subunit